MHCYCFGCDWIGGVVALGLGCVGLDSGCLDVGGWLDVVAGVICFV